MPRQKRIPSYCLHKPSGTSRPIAGDEHSAKRFRDVPIKKANAAGISVPWWFPHQLRHTRGTEVHKKYGVEGAQHSLGLAKLNMAELYAERDLAKAQRIACNTG